jgi:NAD(P)-dependent dehydrogenase (short-subunit alcohol dehydrogenase family)
MQFTGLLLKAVISQSDKIMKRHPIIFSKFELHGQTAIITGGAGLLGRQFCRTLAQAGANVVCADSDLQSAQTLARELTKEGYSVHAFQVDVTNARSNDELAAFAVSQFGKLDVLVTCAALDPKYDREHADQFSHDFVDFPLDVWQRALEINLTGTFLSAQSCIPHMQKNKYGVLVLISSIYGLVGPDQRIYQSKDGTAQFKPPYYSVTKSAVLGLVKYLAAYYAGQPIRVNALSPGGVYNGQSEEFIRQYSSRSIVGRLADEDEMNGALLFLCSPASSYMTGANLVVDGGWTVW